MRLSRNLSSLYRAAGSRGSGQKDPKDLKIITCHLGSGSSIAAVDGGKCVDTSMGLTPLEGLAMGTRSGDIDPAAIPYLMKKYNMTAEEAVTFLNKKCGMLGVSGYRAISATCRKPVWRGTKKADTALKMFCYRVKTISAPMRRPWAVWT